ncbi:MAG: superfamily, partial [Thermoleophilia bacterium]|nr:superfamily [Thermoleophilia bacterium]
RIALVLGVLFAGTVGLSRVVAGVHYPTDVVAGWCLGTGVALVLADLLRHRRDAVVVER